MNNDSKGRYFLSGLLIALLILALGFLADSVFGQLAWFKTQWPNNVYFYSVLLIIGIAVGAISNGNFIKQLASFKALLPSAIILFVSGLLIMIMPLGQGIPYFSHINGLPLVFLLFYFFFFAGVHLSFNFLKLKGLRKLSVIGLLGMLVFLFASINGQNDYFVMKMRTGKNRAIFEASNHDGRVLRTPFALKFLELSLPKEEVEIQIIGTEKENKVDMQGDLKKGDKFTINGWIVNLNQYLEKAVFVDGEFVEKDTVNAVKAAKLKVLTSKGEVLSEGWVCSGSDGQVPVNLDVDGYDQLALIIPKTNSYQTKFRLFDTVSKYDDYTVGNAEEIAFKGWKISVEGFDERYGEASPIIDFHLVFDRWLETRFIGLALILIGLIIRLKIK